MRKQIIFTFVFSLLLTLLSGCNQDDMINEKELMESDIVLFSSDFGAYECNSELTLLYDNDILGSKKIKTDGDISYKFLDEDNQCIYMFGPGGLVKMDYGEFEIEVLSDLNINDISFMSNELYYFHNVGFEANGEYISYIKKMNSKFELEFNYHVADFICFNDEIYTVNSPINIDDPIFIRSYKDGALNKEISVDEFGGFYLFDNELYFLTSTYLMNVNDGNKYYFDLNEYPGILKYGVFNVLYKYEQQLYLIDNGSKTFNVYKVEIEGNTIILDKMNCNINEKVVGYLYSKGNLFITTRDNYYVYDLKTESCTKIEINNSQNDYITFFIKVN